MSERVLNRAEWHSLCAEMMGDDYEERQDVSPVVRMAAGSVEVERFDGVSSVDVFGSRRATDVRIGYSLQILCSRDRVVVLSHPGRFPVLEWAVLYDGPVWPDVARLTDRTMAESDRPSQPNPPSPEVS